MAESLYRRVLGARFDTLDPAVQHLHSRGGHWHCPGRCTVEPAPGRIGRMLAGALGLPRAAVDAEFRFELCVDAEGETWIRHFPHRAMRSRQFAEGPGLLGECLGPARFAFRPEADGGALNLNLVDLRVFGLPWPRRLFPRVHARERGEGARFHFDIDVHLGPLGRLVAYRGHLDLDRIEVIA
ncbi:MAG: DUF4166 domain-containing protein [Xanthomonadales bacterium]|nr:DUF4166 domain-containing protein [Xanthomonadales bacterium]